MNSKAIAHSCAITMLALGAAIGSQALAQMARPMQPTTPPDQLNQYQGLQYQGTDYKIPLSEVKDPETALQTANIHDKDGDWVGSVRTIVMGAGGTPTAVDTDVGKFMGLSSKIVALPAQSLSYEKNRNTLVTNLTGEEIKALPAI